MATNGSVPHVAIIGAGFGGLAAARELSNEPVDVTIVDEHNYHLFQPLLYQVATAGLEPADIAYAVRGVFQRAPNVKVRTSKVTGVDWDARELHVAVGEPLAFDRLIIAAGAVTNTFDTPGVNEHGFFLKSLADAIALRSHVLQLFELADAYPSLVDEATLTFVVVGGGPTGIELAGALSELFRMVLAKDYPGLDIGRTRVVLVEATDAVLGPFSPKLRERSVAELRKREIEVVLGTAVRKASASEVALSDGTTIPSRTLIWAAGVRPNPLAEILGVELTRGRIVVHPDLSVPGHPGVYAVGDIAAAPGNDGRPLPQLAPVAMQAARHAARMILREPTGQQPSPFHYRDKGTMATIGRNAAIAEFPFGLRLHGFLAWLAWLFLHLVLLVGFRNRLSVLLNWAWSYLTYDRAARLIFAPDTYGGRKPPAEAG